VSTARRAAGRAFGALDGDFPEPALGIVPSAGVAIWDEFIIPGDSTVGYGDLRWALVGGGTVTPGPGATMGVIGEVQLATAASANTVTALAYNTATIPAPKTLMPVGFTWAVRILLNEPATTQQEIYSGFVFDPSVRCNGATANDFLGVRAVAGGNLYGVVRDATTESTIDLGVDPEDGYVAVGFELRSDGYQFFTLATYERSFWTRTNVGDPVATTNAPDANLKCLALGMATYDNAAHLGKVDWWAIGGRMVRDEAP
jgi:hypothetical protein